MTGFDKGGNTARRDLDSEPLLQQLAYTGTGNALAFYQIGRQCLDACPIQRRFASRKMLVVGVMVLSSLVALPATSHATAIGIQYWGAFTVNIGGH